MSDVQAERETIDTLRIAHAEFRRVLGNVTPDQWTWPTPSDDWDVRALVNHVVQGNRWVERNVNAEGAEFPTDNFVGEGDPIEVFDASMLDLWAAIDAATSEQRLNDWYVGTRSSEFMIHGWDLAKATGQDTNLAPELNEPLLAAYRIGFDGYDRSKDGLYKEEFPVPSDAPAADRLAGFLGKRVQVN